MSSADSIYYLTRKEIDEERWNSCIDKSDNGLIYSYTFYLDALCKCWDAIIINDYEAVMPLPWGKKWGIKYLFLPPFLPQLGVSGKHNKVDYKELLGLIGEHFLYGDIFFNEANVLPHGFTVQKKTNFILPLDKPYEEMEQQFSTVLKKNIKRAHNNNLQFIFHHDHGLIIQRFQEIYRARVKGITSSQYQNFSDLCSELSERKMLFVRVVEDYQKNILSAGVFLNDAKRIYNVMNLATAEGRKKQAIHHLLTSVFKEFSETKLIFDFEGSDLPGVKEFYLNFNPVYKPYVHYHFNDLPLLLKIIKP